MPTKDERTYIRLHDGMPENPKVVALSDAAFRIYVELLCWCSRNLTDGQVPEAAARRLGTAKARREVVGAGLLEQRDDGWQVHDYLQHQRSADEVAALREKRREAGKKGGIAKANALASAIANEKQSSAIDRDIDKQKTSSSEPRKRAVRIPEDWKPDSDLVAAMRAEGISDEMARRELPKFRDYWAAVGGDRGRKLDWAATWRNWLRRAAENAAPAPRSVVNSAPQIQTWTPPGDAS